MKRIFLALLIALLAFGFWTCKNANEDFNYNDNLETAANNTLAFDIFTDVFKIIHQAFYDSVLHQTGTCEIMDAEANYYYFSEDSIVIKVRYPGFNLLCSDGLYRRGTIIAILTESFTDTSGKAAISFDKYAVEDNIITGAYTIDLKVPAGDKPEFMAVASDVNIQMYDTVRKFIWSADNSIIWDAGSETVQDFNDDVFLFSGTTNGISSTDNNYSSEIIQAISKNRICTWLREGSYAISTPDMIAREGLIEFMSDSCNDLFYMYFNEIMFYEKFLYLFREKEE